MTGETLLDNSTEAAGAAPARHRRWPLWAGLGLLLLVAGAGTGAYAYTSHYADRAVPGTAIAGTDVSGMTRDEIASMIASRSESATVAVSGDATGTATLADLGITVDAGATADAALARGATAGDRLTALFSSEDLPVVTTTDAAVTDAYASSLIPADKVRARNAEIGLDAEGTSFTVTPAVSGTSIDPAPLARAGAEAASALAPASASVSMSTQAPAVSDVDAQAVADTANSWISQDVTISDASGKDSYSPDESTKASWISVSTSNDAAPTLSIDSAKVSSWVADQASEENIDEVQGTRNVNSKGDVVATPVEAVKSQTVKNADALSTSISEALGKGTGYSGAFEMQVGEEKWTQRTIADGAENLNYQAAPGEKWVDVDLSAKTVTSYEGATVVRGPVSIVDGAAETPTVTGTYHVYLKYETQTMRGQNADGSDYVTEDVPWVSYFHSGYAFHGAPWRSSFGYSGSHGCLNMPVDEAQWMYTWADNGTTVVSHY